VHRRREEDWILHETEALLLGIKQLLDEEKGGENSEEG
jgi:hypothetical protein